MAIVETCGPHLESFLAIGPNNALVGLVPRRGREALVPASRAR